MCAREKNSVILFSKYRQFFRVLRQVNYFMFQKFPKFSKKLPEKIPISFTGIFASKNNEIYQFSSSFRKLSEILIF
jgi:hypothetical protein